MKNSVCFRMVCVCTALAIGAICSGTAASQKIECGSVAECAQTAVNAAKAAQAAAEGTQKAVGALISSNKIFVAHSQAIQCNTYHAAPAGGDPWPKSITSIECPPNSVRLSGGCIFTCFGLEHTASFPTESPAGGNGWSCGAVSKDAERKFQAVAVCLRLP